MSLSYFSAATTAGQLRTEPADAPASPFSLTVGEQIGVFADDFETAAGWTVGAPGDTATSGLWIRAEPVESGAQPGFDNPAGDGSLCYITGNAAPGAGVGVNDVDGGATTPGRLSQG